MSNIKQGYKQTEFGEIPSDWEYCTFKDVLNINEEDFILPENGEYFPAFDWGTGRNLSEDGRIDFFK